MSRSKPLVSPTPDNRSVAQKLREVADLLEQQGANPFRVSAYRRAADTVDHLGSDIALLFRKGGSEALTALPGIGFGLAGAIGEILTTGRWAQLERLRGTLAPERLFQTIPGVGPDLARRIHDHLHVDTLETLEIAAHDGRLDTVPGIGARRTAMIRAALANRLARRPRGPIPTIADEPAVDTLLDVDRQYRTAAEEGRLPTIAPRRFNPTGEAWLPILHTHRDRWHFTVLYSNTARAHELGRTRDWVVIYFQADDTAEGQRTVVTELRGPFAGRRSVRGRERECFDFHAAAMRSEPVAR